MKNFLLFIGIFFISFQSCASNYYWVGGTGNYSDVSHWATTSGGSTFQSLPPSVYDDVFFDANSFSSADDTVYFDTDYPGAHYFTVSGVLNTPTFADGPAALRLTIEGNFFLDAAINWISDCELEFAAMADSTILIQTNGVYLPNQLLFGGDVNSAHMLASDLSCNWLQFDNGNFYSMNFNMSCSGFTSFVPTIYLGTSSLTSTGAMDFLDNTILYMDSASLNGPRLDVNIGVTGLNFGTVNAFNYITAEGCYFIEINTPSLQGMGNTIELWESDTAGLDQGVSSLGPNTINKVIVKRIASFYPNTIIDTLIYTQPGAQLGLRDTLILNGNIVMSNSPTYRGAIGSGCISKSSGIVCFDFVDIDSVQATGGAQFFAGYNSAAVGGTSTGWQFTGCTTPGGVWPGDANYDLTVNNLDILAIGLANGAIGPVRAGASMLWIEQPVADWSNLFASGVNMKHADCDGNGIVDPADTMAVSVNYGLTHPAARLIHVEGTVNSNAFLVIDVSPDTVGPSSPVHVNIDLTMDSVYGIAFSVFYNPEIIDASSLVPDFGSSWLGINGVNMIGFVKADPVAGRLDFALTRIDHNNALAGVGQLVSFDLITAPSIPSATSLSMEASNVNGIYQSEGYEIIAGSTDSTVVDSTVSVASISDPIVNFKSYFSNNTLHLNFYAKQDADLDLVLTDITGRTIYRRPLQAIKGINEKKIEVENISGGIYLVTLASKDGGQTIKVIR